MAYVAIPLLLWHCLAISIRLQDIMKKRRKFCLISAMKSHLLGSQSNIAIARQQSLIDSGMRLIQLNRHVLLLQGLKLKRKLGMKKLKRMKKRRYHKALELFIHFLTRNVHLMLRATSISMDWS